MKQIVDKLNKIAKKIDANVDIPDTDLITDSLDAITTALGGTPNDSPLIVDKLEDIYNNAESAPSGNIEITENGENINVAPYATATVNVSGGGGSSVPMLHMTVKNNANENYRLGDEMYSNRLTENYLDFQRFSISPSIEAEHDFLYYRFDESTFGCFMTSINANITYTDLNNCSIITNEDAQLLAIIITNTSANSSVTVTIS